MDASFLILLMFILTLWSAFFSASEISLFSLSSAKVRSYRTHGDSRKQLIAHLLAHPRDLLVTVYVFNTLVNILIQNVASSLFGEYSSWALKVGVPLVVTLVFGEILPKNLALQNNAAVAYRVAPMINSLQEWTKPILKGITRITSFLSRIMFFFLRKEETISKEELQHVLRSSQQHGLLHADEAQLVRGYFNLRDSLVKELMRPREDVISYDVNEPLSKLTHRFVDLECSRIPVCKGNLDNLLGIITASQFFVHQHEFKSPADLQKYLYKPFFIPETARAPVALKQLDERNHEVAMVVDEYGAIQGLISYEDLVEVVIGEIEDRRDENARFTASGDNVVIASGKLELAEFEEIFGVKLNSPNNMVTLGGWLTEHLGDIPKSGANFQIGQFFFHILAADPNRIRRVYIRKNPTDGEEKS
jgi:putative hemolysin